MLWIHIIHKNSKPTDCKLLEEWTKLSQRSLKIILTAVSLMTVTYFCKGNKGREIILNKFHILPRDTAVLLQLKLLSDEVNWPIIANSLNTPDSLLGELLRDCWMDFNETWWEGGQPTKREPFNLGVVLVFYKGSRWAIACQTMLCHCYLWNGLSWKILRGMKWCRGGVKMHYSIDDWKLRGSGDDTHRIYHEGGIRYIGSGSRGCNNKADLNKQPDKGAFRKKGKGGGNGIYLAVSTSTFSKGIPACARPHTNRSPQ